MKAKTVSHEPATLSDESLISHYWATYDSDLFVELVRRFQSLAFRVSVSICRQSSMAEEIVQDVFLKIAKRECPFQDRGPGSFRGWFYSIVINRSRVIYRSEQNYKNRVQKATSRESNEDWEMDPGAMAPIDGIDRNELEQELLTKLASLPENLRLPIILHYLEGRTQQDVAKTLGISASLVKQRITKGLELLRRQMSKAGAVLSLAMVSEQLLSQGDVQVPAELSEKLITIGELAVSELPDPMSPSEQSSAVVQQSSNNTAVLIGLVLASSVFAGGYFSISDSSGTKVVPELPSPIPADTTGNRTSEVFGTWNFDEYAPTREITFTRVPAVGGKPHCKILPRAGKGGTACLEAVHGDVLFFEIDIDELPIQISFDFYLPQQKPNEKYYSIMFGWMDRSGLAEFKNVFPEEKTGFDEWMPGKIFVTEHSWQWLVGDQRLSLHAHERIGNSKMVLLIKNARIRLDNLEIRTIKNEKVPDVSEYLKALDQIPPVKRHGTVPVPELPSVHSKEPAMVKFLEDGSGE